MVVGVDAPAPRALAQPVAGLDAVDQRAERRVGPAQVRERPARDCGVRRQVADDVGSPSTAPGTPVLVEYLGWIFISGRMW